MSTEPWYSGRHTSNTSNFYRENGSGSPYPNTTYSKWLRNHYGKFLAAVGGFYGCVKDGHKIRDCPFLKANGREDNKVTLVVRMIIIKTRVSFMLSKLEYIKWVISSCPFLVCASSFSKFPNFLSRMTFYFGFLHYFSLCYIYKTLCKLTHKWVF